MFFTVEKAGAEPVPSRKMRCFLQWKLRQIPKNPPKSQKWPKMTKKCDVFYSANLDAMFLQWKNWCDVFCSGKIDAMFFTVQKLMRCFSQIFILGFLNSYLRTKWVVYRFGPDFPENSYCVILDLIRDLIRDLVHDLINDLILVLDTQQKISLALRAF